MKTAQYHPARKQLAPSPGLPGFRAPLFTTSNNNNNTNAHMGLPMGQARQKALDKPSHPRSLLQVPVIQGHVNTCLGQSLPLGQFHIQRNQRSAAKALALRHQ